MSDVQVAPSYERTVINAGSFDYLLITSQTDNLSFDILFFENLIRHNRHAMRLKKENATAVITSHYIAKHLTLLDTKLIKK